MKKGKVAKIMKKRILLIIVLLIVLIITIICRNINNNNHIELSTEIQKNLTSNEELTSWTATQQGSGWEYITSITGTSDGGVAGVGSISSYSDSGADVNGDGTADVTSIGNDDGLIVNYSASGSLNWSATLGGEYDENLNKIALTSDGGFVVVGYTSSYDVYYNGTLKSELSIDSTDTNLQNEDGILIKISSSGSYEWGVRIGGTYDDEITSVIETSDGNIAITGRYYSNTFNFYNSGDLSKTQASITKTATYDQRINGFVASYTSSGSYNWSQNINGTYDIEAVDITETTEGIAVAVNHISTVYLDTNKSVSQTGASSSYVNGTVAGYDLDGTYSWRFRLYPSSASYNVKITSLSVGADDEIYVGVNHAYTLYGQQNGGTGTALTSTTTYLAATVVELTNTGAYTDTIYTLDSVYDDYVSDVVGTYDGGVILSGWFYSDEDFTIGETTETDEDEEETTSGYTFSAVTGTYTSDGFVIKLDEDGNIEYADQYAGDGYDNICAVAENEQGRYYVGGSMTSTSLKKTTVTSDDTAGSTIVTSAGNADGFIAYLFNETYTITINYYLLDKDGNQSILTIDSEEISAEVYEYARGYNYSITLSEDISGSMDEIIYTMTSDGDDKSGELTDDIVINYYWQENMLSIEITKVSGEENDADGTKVTLSDAEFTLYWLICEDESHDHSDEKIDVNDYDTSCWEVFGTYTSGSDGIFTLANLPITGIYRLIETKAPDDYNTPNGQWEITFDYESLTSEDLETGYDVLDIITITAIGNPPAFSLETASDDSDTEILYLYNYRSYDLPFTGLEGVTEFYEIAFSLLLMGILMMMCSKARKVYVSKNRSKSRSKHGLNKMKMVNVNKLKNAMRITKKDKNTRRRNRRHSK